MTVKLIIAEKPSMAKDIAFALGGKVENSQGYYKVGEEYLVTYAYGHLFEVCQPAEHNPAWEKWTLEALPMIPENLQHKPSKSSNAQWQIIKSLINRQDVSGIINACDAGREGELIFWLIYNHAGTNKPVKRLWISTLTTKAIREGFANLADAEKYEGLKHAAFLRQEADWLVGINATRCQTLVARDLGAKTVFSLGRVQTPILALIVRRDLTIENFKSATFWAITADFITQNNAAFTSVLINEDKQPRFFDKKLDADALSAKLLHSTTAPFIQSLEKKKVEVKQPTLFDLTTLQREMNKRLGWTAAKTLEVTQTLYEKKLVSYPRTSSSVLSSSAYESDVPEILQKLQELEAVAGAESEMNFGRFARTIIEKDWKLTKRHVNDEKVTDHHAIVPTGNYPGSENTKDELALYEVITKRFLAAFYPFGVDEKTEIIANLENHLFMARGKKIVENGWREVELKIQENEADADADLPEQGFIIEKSDKLTKKDVSVQERKTKPPARYNDDTMLAAMETAGKTIDDEEAREAMKHLGIGTSGGRGDIIEKLIKVEYIERKKKALISTSKGRAVISLLEQSILVSAELTGKWEAALNRVAEKQLAPEKFRQGVRQLTAETVSSILKQLQTSVRFEAENAGDCPKCQVEKRDGKLKAIKGKDEKHYLVCTLGREVCGYISLQPKKKTFLTKLISSRCPKCRKWMIYRKTQTDKHLLSCSAYPACDGVIWLEKLKAPTK